MASNNRPWEQAYRIKFTKGMCGGEPWDIDGGTRPSVGLVLEHFVFVTLLLTSVDIMMPK